MSAPQTVKLHCGEVWPFSYKFCPKCGVRMASAAESLLAYLRKNLKLSVTKRRKGKWQEWVDALEELMLAE